MGGTQGRPRSHRLRPSGHHPSRHPRQRAVVRRPHAHAHVPHVPVLLPVRARVRRHKRPLPELLQDVDTRRQRVRAPAHVERRLQDRHVPLPRRPAHVRVDDSSAHRRQVRRRLVSVQDGDRLHAAARARRHGNGAGGGVTLQCARVLDIPATGVSTCGVCRLRVDVSVWNSTAVNKAYCVVITSIIIIVFKVLKCLVHYDFQIIITL